MRHFLHKAICWYLLRCSKSFHCYEYGWGGRYVALMNERQYFRYCALASDDTTGEMLLRYRNDIRELHDGKVEAISKSFQP